MLQAFYESGLLRENLQPVGRGLLLWVATRRSLPKTSVRSRLSFLRHIYCLTPVPIAPRVMVSGVKPRWLSHLSRFLTHPSVTDSPVSAAFTSPSL